MPATLDGKVTIPYSKIGSQSPRSVISGTLGPLLLLCILTHPVPGGIPIPLFSDGSGSGSGTPSDDDLDDPDDDLDMDDVADRGSIAGDEDSWEDIEVEEEVGGD